MNGIFQLWYEVSIFFYNSDKCQKGQTYRERDIVHVFNKCLLDATRGCYPKYHARYREMNETWFIKTSAYSLIGNMKYTRIYYNLQHFMYKHVLCMKDIHNTGLKWLRIWWCKDSTNAMAVSCKWWNLYLQSLSSLCDYTSVLIQVSR